MDEPVKRNCPWGYSCTKKWDELLKTRDEHIRFCSACQSEVYWATDREELAEFICLNRCVCFNSELITNKSEPNESQARSVTLLGMAMPDVLSDADEDDGLLDRMPTSLRRKSQNNTFEDDLDDDIPF